MYSVNEGKAAKTAIISSLMMCLVIGVAYCWSVFEKTLVQDYGWTNTQASLPYSAFMLCYAVMMLMGGKIQGKFGIRRVCMFGSTVFVSGLCLAFLLPTVVGITLGFGVLIGAGQGMCYSCVVSTPLKWCAPEKRGLFSGLTTGAVGLTSIYMTPLITGVIARANVRYGFLTMLAFVAPVMLLCSHNIRSPQEALAEKPQRTNAVPFRIMLQQKALYQIFFLSFSCSLYGQIIVSHIANIAYVQAEIENGFFFVLLLSASNCTGRFFCGFLSDYIAGPKLMRGVYGIGALNILLFSLYRNAPLLVIGTVLIGLGYGASHSVVPSIISRCFGTENFGSYFGLTSLAAGLAGIFGPLFAGYMMDSTGSYALSYLASAVCLGAASFVSGTIRLSEE